MRQKVVSLKEIRANIRESTRAIEEANEQEIASFLMSLSPGTCSGQTAANLASIYVAVRESIRSGTITPPRWGA